MTPEQALSKLENKKIGTVIIPETIKISHKRKIVPKTLGRDNLFLNIFLIITLIVLVILFIIYYGDRRYTTGYLDGHQDQITYEKNK